VRHVYLDNNATTPVDEAVVGEMLPYFRGDFGNASSAHTFGQRARSAVETARERVASLIGASPREVIFTCGGTEADNAALMGVARAAAPQGGHLVTTRVEHPAVLRTSERLETEGYRVTYLGVDEKGLVSLDELKAALCDDTVLLSVMYVNNETGVIQPMGEIVELARSRGIPLHTDAVQAAGKIPLDVDALEVDLLSISAHKLHGPKGVGALYVRDGTPFASFLLGGGHERNRRGGTENVPGIVGLGKACELAGRHLEEMATRVRGLRDRLESLLLQAFPDARINGATEVRAPHVTNIGFPGLRGESLLIALDFEGIAVSTGAACASGSISPSHVLVAMGLTEERIEGAIRFSLGRLTTEDEIEFAGEAILATLRRMTEATWSSDVQ
jgi:cysteine desulfurase